MEFLSTARRLATIPFGITRRPGVRAWLAVAATAVNAANPSLSFTRLPDIYPGAPGGGGAGALADINHDGRPDLIRPVLFSGSDFRVSVQTGQAAGGFGTATYYPVGLNTDMPIVADLNNDTHPDIVVANANSFNTGVLLGNGDGTFQAHVPTATGLVTVDHAITDYDKDNKPDLIVVGYSASPFEGIIKLLRGNGDGTFTVAATLNASVRSLNVMTRAVAVADLNGDTYPDFVVSNPVGSAIRVFLNNQDGTFTGQTEVTVNGPPGAVALADFNGDGRADLALAHTSDTLFGNIGQGNNIGIVLGNGDGTFATQSSNGGALPTQNGITRYSLSSGGNSFGRVGANILLADFNGDGRIDLAALAESTTTAEELLGILRGNGDGTFTHARQLSATFGSRTIAAADINGDSSPDLVAFKDTTSQRFVTGIPTVAWMSPESSEIRSTSVRLYGTVEDGGGASVTRRGYVLAPSYLNSQLRLDSPWVTVVDSPVDPAGGNLGAFTTRITGLTASTAYSVRAFAVTVAGTGYSSPIGFTTAAPPPPGSLVVTTLVDEDDGTAAPGTGAGTSLREAVQYANLLGGDLTVSFSSDLFAAGPATLPLTLGEVVIDNPVGTTRIAGPGAHLLTIDAALASRILRMDSEAAVLEGIRFARGSSTSTGGAFRGFGSLTAIACVFSDNHADTHGGAVYCYAGTFTGCTFLSNSAGAGYIAGHGGAIAHEGPVVAVNSTFHGNAATSPDTASGTGGAIHSRFSAALRLLACTVTGNSADGSGGGIDTGASGAVAIFSSLITGNTAPANPDLASNLDAAAEPSNIIGTDPLQVFRTGTPELLGGTTPTIALRSGSPAIDIGDTSRFTLYGLAIPATDQRGVARIIGPAMDAGAFESPALPSVDSPSVTGVSPTGATLGGNVTADGGAAITRRGIVFAPSAVNASPTVGGAGVTEVEVAGTLGVFTIGVAGLTPMTAYSFAAFAVNEAGTAHTPVGTFQYTPTPSLVVSTLADEHDGTSDPLLGTGTSLREALADAAALGGSRTITFNPALTAGGPVTLTLGGSQLEAAGQVTVTGPGTDRLTIDANAASRALQVAPGATVVLTGLRIVNGRSDGPNPQLDGGAGILNRGSLVLEDCILSGHTSGGTHRCDGGALRHLGTALSVNRTTFHDNTAAGGGYGGAIALDGGTVDLAACTFSDNGATPTSGNGGAVANFGAQTVIVNCTFSGNHAANGGAIIHYGNVLTLRHCTVAGNTATFTGGGVERVGREGNDVHLANCLVALNTAPSGPDTFSYPDANPGPFTSAGGNLIGQGDGALGFGHGINGDLVGSTAAPLDPLLGPLQNNGGPTGTRVPSHASPAKNAAIVVPGLTGDQRGEPRVVGSAPDIGSVELNPDNLAPVAQPDALDRPDTTRVVKVLRSVLLGNDSDPDLDPLGIASVANATPAGATVSLSGSFVVYVAPSATAGPGTFEYSLSDGSGGHLSVGTVSITQTASGTTETPPNSVAARVDGGTVRVGFIGIPGRTYGLQFTPSIAPPYQWRELDPPVDRVAPPGGVLELIDPDPADPIRLYRAILRP